MNSIAFIVVCILFGGLGVLYGIYKYSEKGIYPQRHERLDIKKRKKEYTPLEQEHARKAKKCPKCESEGMARGIVEWSCSKCGYTIRFNRSEKLAVFLGLDDYQWHLLIYATVGSLLYFYTRNWIDSHVPEYHATSIFLLAVPAVFNFFFLFVIFRRMNPRSENPTVLNTLVAPILTALSVSAVWIFVCLVFHLKVHLFAAFFHFLMAGVIGFGARIHYYDLLSIPLMTREEAERNYKTSVDFFGNILQMITLMLVSGGLFLVISFGGEFGSLYLIEGTESAWIVGAVIFMIYLAYGAYCIFLARLLDTQADLNDHIVNQERLELDRLKGIRLEEDIEENE